MNKILFSFFLLLMLLLPAGHTYGGPPPEDVAESFVNILQGGLDDPSYGHFAPDESTLVVRIWAPKKDSYQGHVSVQTREEYLSVWNQYPSTYAPIDFKTLENEPHIDDPDLIRFFVANKEDIAKVNSRIRKLQKHKTSYSIGKIGYELKVNNKTYGDVVRSKNELNRLIREQMRISTSDKLWAAIYHASRDITVKVNYKAPTGKDTNCFNAACEALDIGNKLLLEEKSFRTECSIQGKLRWNFRDIDLLIVTDAKTEKALVRLLPLTGISDNWRRRVEASTDRKKYYIYTTPGEYMATGSLLSDLLTDEDTCKDKLSAILLDYFDAHDYIPINFFSRVCPRGFACVHTVNHLTRNEWREAIYGKKVDSLSGLKDYQLPKPKLFLGFSYQQLEKIIYSFVRTELASSLNSSKLLKELSSKRRSTTIKLYLTYLLSSSDVRGVGSDFNRFANDSIKLIKGASDIGFREEKQVIGSPFYSIAKRINLVTLASILSNLEEENVDELQARIDDNFAAHSELSAPIVEQCLDLISDPSVIGHHSEEDQQFRELDQQAISNHFDWDF